MDDRVGGARRYTASIDTEAVIDDALEHGIKPFFGMGFVPLATTLEDAVVRLMTDLVDHKMSEPKYVAVFCINLPTSTKLEQEKYKISEVKFYAYKGTLPPKYITMVEEVEVEKTK